MKEQKTDPKLVCAILLMIIAFALIIFTSLVDGAITGLPLAADAVLLVLSVLGFARLLHEHRRRILTRSRVRIVAIREPVNLNRNKVIKIKSEANLLSIARRRNVEILTYTFSPTMRFYYILIDGYTYLYAQNRKEPGTRKERLRAPSAH